MDRVRLAIRRISRDIPGRDRLASPGADFAPDGVPWIKFGEEVVYCGAGDDWSRLTASAERAGVALRAHPDPIERERLHVVSQKGRLFQREHPDVPVLVDKGRYLLVELDPARARELNDTDVPCYSVRALDALAPAGPEGQNRVVFESHGRAAADLQRAPDPAVQAILSRISRQTFESDLTRLVQFPTRFSTSSHYTSACDFVEQALAALGYATSRPRIVVRGAPSHNVTAQRNGSGSAPRGLVLVTAHLDSINEEGTASSRAPGADDDGSGSAGVLEIARAIKNQPSVNDVQFVLFGGEEQGLFGSKQFVASMTAADRARVRAVVHMDMIACLNADSPGVLLEGADLSRAVIDGLEAAAGTYTQLEVQTSTRPERSDHVSFIEKGVPAVLTIEGTDGANHAIHSERDNLELINFELALDILRMNTAFVADALARA
jgi:Peptidase family M28